MAPDFRLESTSGQTVRLYDYKNKKTVLLFFFDHQKDKCLERLKALAADHGKFEETSVAIFPISIIKAEDGKALADKLGLPFGVLCDDDHSVSKAYKVSRCSEPGHVCFQVLEKVESPTFLVIDTSGIIRQKHSVGTGEPDDEKLLKECREALK